MSFIGSGLYSLLRRAGLPFAAAGICGGTILVLYTVMIGGSVSAVRALVMFLIRAGADVWGRDYDLPTSLLVSAANSHFPRPAGPHFPASQGHIKRSALEIGRARGAPPC